MTKTSPWQECILVRGEKATHPLGNLRGIKYEEAEDVFHTNKRKRKDVMTTFNVAGTDVTMERLSLVSFMSERMYSFQGIIGQSEDTQALDKHESLAFCKSNKEKVDLFIPNALGGGKRLECTPYLYYQVPPGVSKLKRMQAESKPDILKATASIFFVLRENQEVTQEFLTNGEFEEYNEDSAENAKAEANYLIYIMR